MLDVFKRRHQRRVLRDAVADAVDGTAGARHNGLRQFARSAWIQRGGDHAASGEKQEFASAGGFFESLRYQMVHVVSGYQHIQQRQTTARLHIHRRDRHLIEAPFL